MNRGGFFDESESEGETGRAAFPPPLRWSEVEDFFREHGCVIVGDPELAWYREAWGALEEAGLAGAAEFAPLGLDRTMPRLRALCLPAMYLGIYQAAGEESALGGYFPGHPPRDRYFESLGLDIWELWELARTTGMIETDAEVYWEEEEDAAGRARARGGYSRLGPPRRRQTGSPGLCGRRHEGLAVLLSPPLLRVRVLLANRPPPHPE